MKTHRETSKRLALGVVAVLLIVIPGICLLVACNQDRSGSQEGQTSAGNSTATVGNTESVDQVARNAVQELAKGKMADFVSRFDSTMKSALPEEKLSLIWKDLVGKSGAFQKIVGVRLTQAQGFDLAFVTCKFERGAYDLQLTFDKKKQISGFFIRPPSASGE